VASIPKADYYLGQMSKVLYYYLLRQLKKAGVTIYADLAVFDN